MPPPVTVSPRTAALELSHSQFELALAMGRDDADAGIEGYSTVWVDETLPWHRRDIVYPMDSASFWVDAQPTDECCSGCLTNGPESCIYR